MFQAQFLWKKGNMITIKDVAARAGVPEKTAMRALSGATMGKRRDARERMERVQKAAAELGYQPSEIAKALRKGRTRTIGLMTGNITNRYYASLAETVLDESERLGYRMILELTRWDAEKSILCLEHLQRFRVDGIFYASGHFPEERHALEKLRGAGIPLVMLYQNAFGIASVGRDHSASLPLAVRDLAERGAREITLSAWNSRTPQDEILIDLFLSACRKSGIAPALHRPRSLADMDALAEAAPGALICDAPNCLKYFSLRIRDNHAYHPYVTGIYDEWNWPDRPESLSGAILLPSEKQVRLAVRELIGQIEHGSPPSSISLQSHFFPCEKFGEIPVNDLSFRHLFPF